MRRTELFVALAALVSAVTAHSGGNESHHAEESTQGLAALGSSYPDIMPVAVAVVTAGIVFLAGVSYLHYRGSIEI